MKYLFSFLFTCQFFCLAAQTDTTNTYNAENVIITGQFQPTDVRSALHQAKIITSAEIQRRGAVNVGDLLAQESNIRIQNDPVLGTSLSLNGLSGRNIKFLMNGVPMVGRQNGNIDLSQLNVFNIERIEIIEGPMAIMYGSDAIAGVINIITKQYSLKKWKTELQTRAETRGAQVGSAAITFQPNNNQTFRLGGGYNAFKGWAANDSSRDWRWNPKKQGNMQLAWTFRTKKNIRLNVTADGMREMINNLGEVRRPQFKPYAFDENYFTRRIHTNASLDVPINDKHFIAIVLGTDRYFRRKDSYRTDLTTNEQVLQVAELDTSVFDMKMLRAIHAWKIANKFSLQSGINIQLDTGKGRRFADSTHNNVRNMSDYALFVTGKWTITPRLSSEMGLRTAYNTQFTIPIIPSCHLKYNFPKHDASMRVSYARGFRAPDFKEMYFQFIDFNHNIVGNQNLKPEDAHTFQASFDKNKELKASTLTFGARLFFNNIKDKIDLYEYQLVDGIKIPVTDTSTLLYSYFNLEHYQTLGGTINTKWKNDWLTVGLSSTTTGYLTPNYKEYGVARYTWAIDFQGEVSVKIPKIQTNISTYHHWNDKQISYYYEQINGINTLTERTMKGFLSSDLIIAQSFWKEKIKLSLGARNIFNVQQVNIVGKSAGQSHISDAQVNIGPGRSYWTQLSFRF
jgi:outer membrane receptor for ferrienterochelin and colicins